MRNTERVRLSPSRKTQETPVVYFNDVRDLRHHRHHRYDDCRVFQSANGRSRATAFFRYYSRGLSFEYPLLWRILPPLLFKRKQE